LAINKFLIKGFEKDGQKYGQRGETKNYRVNLIVVRMKKVNSATPLAEFTLIWLIN